VTSIQQPAAPDPILRLAAPEDRAVIGFYVLLLRPDGIAELDGLFVEPSAWGKGIGRHLLARAEAAAHSAAAQRIHVVANPRAAGFYAACSYKRIGMETTRFGPAIGMAKILSNQAATLDL